IFQHTGYTLGGTLPGTDLTADSEHLGLWCGPRRRPLRWTCRHDGDERRDHTRIERIALGQDPARPRELPQFERIDLAHGHAGGEQGACNTTLVAAARLDADPRDRAPTQALNQICPTGSVVAHRTALLLGQHDDVQTILRHVDSAKREHLRIPSLLMRARAQATVRVWKKRPELQAHSRFANPSACGLPVATGLSDDHSAPVRSHDAPFPSYKAPRVHHADRWCCGGVAARDACAARRADAAHWRADGNGRARRSYPTGSRYSVPAGTREAGMDRRAGYPHRYSLGRRRSRSHTALRGGAGSAPPRCDSG